MSASSVAILSIQISQHSVVMHLRWGGDLCSRYLQPQRFTALFPGPPG